MTLRPASDQVLLGYLSQAMRQMLDRLINRGQPRATILDYMRREIDYFIDSGAQDRTYRAVEAYLDAKGKME